MQDNRQARCYKCGRNLPPDATECPRCVRDTELMCELEALQLWPVLEVCACCLAPAEVSRQVDLKNPGGNGGIRLTLPWCRGCWRRYRIAKFLMWIAGGIGVGVGICAGYGADRYGASGWLDFVIGLIAGFGGLMGAYWLFFCWPPFNQEGHAHLCEAIRSAHRFSEFKDGRARIGYRIYLGNKRFVELLRNQLGA